MKNDLKAMLLAKNAEKDAIKAEYKEKEKAKKLSTDERLNRIERILGLDK